MQLRSEAFDAQVRQPAATVVSRVEVLVNSVPARTIDTQVSGSVTAERTVDLRRNATISLVDADGALTPGQPFDLLAPGPNQLRVSRGVTFPDGREPEFVPLMTGRIKRVGGKWPYLDVELADLARVVQRNKLTQPYVVAKGTLFSDAIAQLILDRYPEADLNLPSIEWTTPQLVFEERDDPWQKAREMAESCGMEIFTDRLGRFVMREVPSPAEDPLVWTFDDTVDDSMLVSAEPDWDDEDTFNYVVGTATNPSTNAVLRSVAYDQNPESSTYVDRYGRVVDFYESPYFNSQAQLDAATAARLRIGVVGTRTASLSVRPQPALDPSDCVTVSYSKQASMSGNFLVDRVECPLGAAGQMGLLVRNRAEIPTGVQ